MKTKFKAILVMVFAITLPLSFLACEKESWKPGMPLPKEKIKVGVVHITDPFSETSGYSYAHQKGIEEMQAALSLADSQVIYKIHIDDADLVSAENAHRELVAQGANIIFSTSWGYMDICEKLAQEFPSVVFAHASGYKYNKTNFTNYFGRIYQARYLAGIAAGLKTKTNKIGFVAAQGKENSEVSGGLNAFAIGVEKVNPNAKIYVKVTHSWFDPMGEAFAARTLLTEGSDVIAQHCDTPTPMTEAEKAKVWGIGYNTDMSEDAPDAVLTSVIWHWSAYYTFLVKSVIDGSFTTTPWFGSLKEGMVDIVPLNPKIPLNEEASRILEVERQRIESGTYDVFQGVMKTNDGKTIGTEGKNLADEDIRSGINWYYHTVIE